jgi:hypothetical protein
MKPVRRIYRVRAFTLMEVMALCFLFLILALIFLPAYLNRSRPRPRGSQCVNNLKQMGLAFKTWALDSEDKYPMQASTTNGGTLGWVEGPYAYRHFQAMSNELSTPRLLICPMDGTRRPATNFGAGFSNSNLSYFVGVDAMEGNPSAFLSGDRNLTNGALPPDRLLRLLTNSLVSWTAELHNQCGNLLLADGSVQQVSTARLRLYLAGSGMATNRLAMP